MRSSISCSRAHRNARLMPPGLGRLAVASLGAAALGRSVSSAALNGVPAES